MKYPQGCARLIGCSIHKVVLGGPGVISTRLCEVDLV